MAIASILDYMSAQNGNHVFSAEANNLPVEQTALRAFLPIGLPVNLAEGLPTLLAKQPHTPPTTPINEPCHTAAVVQTPVRGVTLNQLLERFRRESGHLAASTRKKLECHFVVAKRHLDFDRVVSEVKVADLRELKSKLCEGRKPVSVNDIIFKGLGPLFEMAVDDGLIERSPLERLQRIKQREPDRRNLSWPQAQAIETEVARNAPETGLIIGLIRNFGVGQAEIRKLLGEHVDVENSVIHFRRKKTGKPFDVPIFPEAKPFVERLEQEGRLQPGKPVVQWRNPRRALESACNRLGIDRFEPRAFRRAFIVHALESGVEARIVARWQGHKDATLILKVYGKHIDAGYEKMQAQKLSLSAPVTVTPDLKPTQTTTGLKPS